MAREAARAARQVRRRAVPSALLGLPLPLPLPASAHPCLPGPSSFSLRFRRGGSPGLLLSYDTGHTREQLHPSPCNADRSSSHRQQQDGPHCASASADWGSADSRVREPHAAASSQHSPQPTTSSQQPTLAELSGASAEMRRKKKRGQLRTKRLRAERLRLLLPLLQQRETAEDVPACAGGEPCRRPWSFRAAEQSGSWHSASGGPWQS